MCIRDSIKAAILDGQFTQVLAALTRPLNSNGRTNPLDVLVVTLVALVVVANISGRRWLATLAPLVIGSLLVTGFLAGSNTALALLCSFLLGAMVGHAPVSYTHLDVYKRQAQGAITPLPIARAQGSRFWDYDGKDYLDFSSGLVHANIGYGHPKLVAAVQEQAGRMATLAPGYAVDVRSEAARLIASKAPDGLEMVFFTNGGAEATENAIRMARLHTCLLYTSRCV